MDSAINSNINSGIGSEVLKNTHKSVVKNDEKADSSLQNLLDKKDIFKKANLPIKLTTNEEKNSQILEKLVNKLLDEIKSSSNLLIKNTHITNSTKALQIAPNLSQDIKKLTKILDNLQEKLPNLRELNAKLKEFLKPIADIKTAPLKHQIQKSGIMLEATIKDALREENLPKSINNLINEMKRVSSNKLIKEFAKLAQNETPNIKESFKELEKILDNAKTSSQEIIKNPKNMELKNLNISVSKLENIVKFLNKLNSKNIISQNSTLLNEQTTLAQTKENLIKNEADIINKFQDIKEKNGINLENTQKSPLQSLLKTDNKSQINSIKEEVITKEISTKLINNISKNINTLKNQINSLNIPKSESISQLQKEVNTIINDLQNSLNNIKTNQENMVENFIKNIATDNPSTKNENFTIQDKLNAAVNKLKQISKLTNREFSDAKITLNETKNLLKTFNKSQNELQNITQNNRSEVISNLSNDIKNTLLKINKSTENSTLPNANQANTITNKLIAQIDIHQLASFATNSIQTYMPYIWDCVDGGNIAFKQGKKNKYYCKIDLNFKEHGSLNVILSLSKDKFLEICIVAQSENFKNLIMENSKELKKAVINTGLNITNFTLKTMSKNTLLDTYQFSDMFDLGFDKRA